MRIEPKTISPISVGEQREQAPHPTAKPVNSSASIVDISTAASAAQAASETGDPKVTMRIAQIKEMLQADSYPIDLHKLASRIVDDEVLRGGGQE